MANTSSDNEVAWLRNTLSELLSAPHISFRSPPGIRMGPGPVDMFSTKFNNAFTPDVRAVVAGEEVNREDLKEKFLALQRHYGAQDTIKFSKPETSNDSTAESVLQDGHVKVHLLFTGVSKELGEYEVSAAAVVSSAGGGRKISSLKLDGKPELFVRSTV